MTQDDAENPYQKFETKKIQSFDSEELPQEVLMGIKLNKGVTPTNFYCAQINSIINVFGFSVIGSLQPLILLDKGYYNIDQSTAGELTSAILIIQSIMKLIVSVPYGHLSDKFGRKAMIYYGAISCLLSCFIIPTQRSIFPGFIIGKLLLANGASAIHSVPLIGDYIHDESKGKGIGLSAFIASSSALFANLYLKVLLYSEFGLEVCYITTGLLVFCALIANSFGLRGGRYYMFHNADPNTVIAQPPFKERFKEGLQLLRGNNWLILSLILVIVGSADFYIFFTFLVLYIKSMLPEDVTDTAFNIQINNLETYAIIPGIVANFSYGYMLDKKNKPLEMSIFALSGGLIASLLTCFINGPYDGKIALASFIIGFTVPGLFIISMYISLKHIPSDKRGIMIGIKTLFGSLGYFCVVVGNGFIYDYWRKDGPFILCTIMMSLALAFIVGLVKRLNY